MLRQKKEFCGTNEAAAGKISMEAEGMAIGFAVCPPRRSEKWALRATNVHKHTQGVLQNCDCFKKLPENPEVCSDKRKPRMLLRHRTS